jgi:uncharacterized membrane protein
MNKLVFFLMLLSGTFGAFAQSAENEGLREMFYGSGKIYVVVATVLLIFAGIIIYIISVDRKVKKLEHNLKNRK